MKRSSHLFILSVIILLLASCTSKPTAVPVPDTPEPTPELIEAAPTENPDTEETEVENAFFEIEETKTTLLVYGGEVRVSHDAGDTWIYTDTGLWLESGDRIQVSEGGIALILFPDGSLIRLEGFTDFELVLNEFDFEAGTKRVIGRVLEGAALVTTVPLPNAESLFQLWLMTGLIDLPYNPAQAIKLDQAEQVPEEDRITFGAAIREEFDGESLFSYSALIDFYVLEIVEGEYVLIKTKPLEDQLSQYDIPFRENIEHEFELEGLLDMAGGVIEMSRVVESITDLDFFGYSMIEEGELADNQILYSFFPTEELDEFLEEAEDPAEKQEFINYLRTRPSYKRHQLHYRYYKNIPDIFDPAILLMIDKYNMGCDIRSGLGCGIPEGCNQENGEGCELTSGCNIITREDCDKARLSCIAYTNCDWAPCGRRPIVTHFCKPRIRTYCDPNVAGDCDEFLASNAVVPVSGSETETDTSEGTVTDQDDAGQNSDTGTDQSTSSEDSFITTIPIDLVQNADKAGEPLIDPNDPVSCEPFNNPLFWIQYDLLNDDLGDNLEGEDDIEWCTCTASVPPNYPPPPPWMDMTYRCWCSD